ncbi:MAG: UDP-N-acetylmuramoyl-L-alanine--D-glutamate ligase [Acidobacteriaceae bacterium]|nr:UDP-N-acetylmuramoyl-L-alanine--D-glutamate ligase [Acidobacteriaceae bacterium]MBV9939651.1 UDP-N-acetylmuramoyl-L-alanine--D-glutamate ligase [Acidobacteriaceae bacterium]
MDLRGKQVVVIGTKRSGLAAIELLLKRGAHVRAMDASPLTPEEERRFAALGVPVLPQEPEYLKGDLIVLSPAVPYDLPMLADAREHGIAVIGEVELSSYFLKGAVIGITGSNGKTTTTALTGHLLKECGIPCQVGGNIGTAVTSLVDSSADNQWNVLELSSFQLESISHFNAKIGVCLNVTPDHLDRHGTFENYANAKARLFETQGVGDYAVLNLEDQVCRSFARRTKAQACWFSTSQPVPHGLWMRDDQLFWDKQPLMRRNDIKLRGLHNVENVMAAALTALLAGASPQQIGSAVASFPGVEHRIEFVRNLEGVNYFNDSKATNVDASLKAIDAFHNGLWIILGGKDKGSDYTPLREPLQQRAKAALLIGAEPPYPYAAAPLIRTALGNVVPVVDCGTLDSAVQYARAHAQPGDTVLLAPACASFDQFQNFEERGKVFKQLVKELF